MERRRRREGLTCHVNSVAPVADRLMLSGVCDPHPNTPSVAPSTMIVAASTGAATSSIDSTALPYVSWGVTVMENGSPATAVSNEAATTVVACACHRPIPHTASEPVCEVAALTGPVHLRTQ